MRKFIVTTTINPPTEALIRFSKMEDWTLVVVGDQKTPHYLYRDIDCDYLTPEYQEQLYPELSRLIGWNCIQRRNIGFIYAYKQGADIIATVDDDNIPYDHWGKDLIVGKKIKTHHYKVSSPVADPLSVTSHPELWHRGFPIEYLKESRYPVKSKRMKSIKCLVQADLWDGEADVDAIERIFLKTDGTLIASTPYSFDKIVPFNSQNTFIAREALKDYFLFPHIGRLDDIWAAYYLQRKLGKCVVFNARSVFQKRNDHNVVKDMENEMIGYKYSGEFATTGNMKLIPETSREAFKEYQRLLK